MGGRGCAGTPAAATVPHLSKDGSMADALFTREALALSMFNTVRAAEKEEAPDRAYTLDLLAEIIATIDGTRGPDRAVPATGRAGTRARR
jgi:hypothetical protein